MTNPTKLSSATAAYQKAIAGTAPRTMDIRDIFLDSAPKLATMPRDEKDKAILRLSLPDTVFQRMPPPRFRGLSPDEIQLVTQELMK